MSVLTGTDYFFDLDQRATATPDHHHLQFFWFGMTCIQRP